MKLKGYFTLRSIDPKNGSPIGEIHYRNELIAENEPITEAKSYQVAAFLILHDELEEAVKRANSRLNEMGYNTKLFSQSVDCRRIDEYGNVLSLD